MSGRRFDRMHEDSVMSDEEYEAMGFYRDATKGGAWRTSWDEADDAQLRTRTLVSPAASPSSQFTPSQASGPGRAPPPPAVPVAARDDVADPAEVAELLRLMGLDPATAVRRPGTVAKVEARPRHIPARKGPDKADPAEVAEFMRLFEQIDDE